MTHTKGTYIKPEGANWGLYFNGKKWVSFECLGCVIAKGLIIPSQRINPNNRLNKKIGRNFTELHDKEIHNQWLKDGKPYRKE